MPWQLKIQVLGLWVPVWIMGHGTHWTLLFVVSCYQIGVEFIQSNFVALSVTAQNSVIKHFCNYSKLEQTKMIVKFYWFFMLSELQKALIRCTHPLVQNILFRQKSDERLCIDIGTWHSGAHNFLSKEPPQVVLKTPWASTVNATVSKSSLLKSCLT